MSEAYRVLVKHLDEASNPSTRSHHSHSFSNFHHGSDYYFSDDEYDDNEYYDEDDEYYDSDDEVAFYLSANLLPSNDKLTNFMHLLRYVFENILKNRYTHLRRNPNPRQ